MLHQDTTALERAMAKLNRVMRLAGCDSLRLSSWKISELGWPSRSSAAVQAAARADVVVAAVSAAEKIPPELQAWFDAWLPHRTSRRSALVALIGAAGRPGNDTADALAYFRGVARKGGLDFFSECMAPETSITA